MTTVIAPQNAATEPATSPSLPQVPSGLSSFEEALYRRLVAHVASEEELLAEYRRLAEDPDIPDAARFVLTRIAEDEDRHHQWFTRIALSLGSGVSWRPHPDAVPSLPWRGQPALRAVTRRLLAAERADRRELRSLRRQLTSVADTTLWDVLVRVMERETAIHIELLRFVDRHVARTRRR